LGSKVGYCGGLKQLLIDANVTIELIVAMGYRELSQMLHIDPYVGKLIVEAVQNFIQEKDPGPDTS
jgi:hypothetical protein